MLYVGDLTHPWPSHCLHLTFTSQLVLWDAQWLATFLPFGAKFAVREHPAASQNFGGCSMVEFAVLWRPHRTWTSSPVPSALLHIPTHVALSAHPSGCSHFLFFRDTCRSAGHAPVHTPLK